MPILQIRKPRHEWLIKCFAQNHAAGKWKSWYQTRSYLAPRVMLLASTMFCLSSQKGALRAMGEKLSRPGNLYEFLLTSDGNCSHLRKLLCKWAQFTQINFESSFSSPRWIIYRNQAMTPPGRWLRHINASTNFIANTDTTVVEMNIQ